MKQIIVSLVLFCTINTISAQSKKTSQTKNTTLVSNESVDYRVTQDQDNLYVSISTADNQTIKAMLHLGLTVYFDIKEKKKKNVYVKYPIEPIRPNRNRNQELSNEPLPFEEENLTKNRFLEIIENDLSKEAEYKYFDNKESFHILLNNLNISISYDYNETNGLLEYYLKVPKYKINSDTKKDFSKLMIGVKTNEIKQKNRNSEKPNINMGGRGSGGQGGPPGGGQGGNQGGQSEKSQISDKNQDKSGVALEFWFKVNIE